jgi:hypothetical protein
MRAESARQRARCLHSPGGVHAFPARSAHGRCMLFTRFTNRTVQAVWRSHHDGSRQELADIRRFAAPPRDAHRARGSRWHLVVPGQGRHPFWSNHVAAWYRSALDAEHYCRKHDLSTASSVRWARHLLSADDLRKRAEDRQKFAGKEPRRQPKKGQSNTPKTPQRNRYSVRTDSGPIALGAFWSMQVEAMNWSGMAHGEYAAALVCRRMRCAFGAIGWNNPATKWTGEPGSSECPGSIKQRC